MQYQNKKLGNGFVACHIWGDLAINYRIMRSCQNHLYNSFIPNVVWLPYQFSNLTDREGYTKEFLKAVSYKIYKNVTIPKNLDYLWDALPRSINIDAEKIDVSQLNFFKIPDPWITKRINSLTTEIDILLSKNIDAASKVKTNRYLPTLKKVTKADRREFDIWLTNYKKWVLSRS